MSNDPPKDFIIGSILVLVGATACAVVMIGWAFHINFWFGVFVVGLLMTGVGMFLVTHS